MTASPLRLPRVGLPSRKRHRNRKDGAPLRPLIGHSVFLRLSEPNPIARVPCRDPKIRRRARLWIALDQNLHPLRREVWKIEEYASDVAPWSRKGSCHTAGDRVRFQIDCDNRNGARGRSSRVHTGGPLAMITLTFFAMTSLPEEQFALGHLPPLGPQSRLGRERRSRKPAGRSGPPRSEEPSPLGSLDIQNRFWGFPTSAAHAPRAAMLPRQQSLE